MMNNFKVQSLFFKKNFPASSRLVQKVISFVSVYTNFVELDCLRASTQFQNDFWFGLFFRFCYTLMKEKSIGHLIINVCHLH